MHISLSFEIFYYTDKNTLFLNFFVHLKYLGEWQFYTQSKNLGGRNIEVAKFPRSKFLAAKFPASNLPWQKYL